MESPAAHIYAGNNGNARSSGVGKNQRYSMYWTLEKEILLIKYFEQHRYMWDTNHILFHKREPRMQGFAELVELLGIDEGTIRQRWSSMRSQFCREERKVSLCPTYIPTWDHYSALQFLRKPFEELQGSRNSDNAEVVPELQEVEVSEEVFADSPQSGLDHLNEEANRPSGFRVSRIADQLAGRLTGQYGSSPQYDDEKDDSSYAVTTNTPPPLDIKTEPPSDMQVHGTIPSSIAQAPTPSQLIRKYKTPRQRRWTPAYNKKYQEITTLATASMNNNTAVVEQSRTSTENDAFVQYISSVLERFPPDKQRRCRNELLCIILKYDTLEDDVAISPTSHE